MGRPTPYLVRRGNVFYFRTNVPLALRPAVGAREIVRSLHTQDWRQAQPLALELGAAAKRVFAHLRQQTMSSDSMKETLRQAREALRLLSVRKNHEREIDELHEVRLRQVAMARLEGSQAALRDVALGSLPGGRGSPSCAPVEPGSAVSPAQSQMTLGSAINDFLGTYATTKAPMLKKHNAVLPLVLQVIGDIPVEDLRQADFNKFFDVVCKLPPRWIDLGRQKGLTAIELAGQTHAETLSKKTFESTYKASVSSFLALAQHRWGDEGFPLSLNVRRVEYKGTRTEAERSQRPFTTAELERLFHGGELLRFRENIETAHMFWLPALALYSGARVNELCQLNPLTDLLLDAGTGIAYCWINPDTEGDERITKTVKKPKVSKRKVPIHDRLVALGFMDYVNAMKVKKAKLLFPAWAPSRQRASPQAEKWFRQVLVEYGLRDETPGAALLGMHAFRSTFWNRADNTEPPVDVSTITGHANGVSAVVRGYVGERDLRNKVKLLHQIDFGFVL